MYHFKVHERNQILSKEMSIDSGTNGNTMEEAVAYVNGYARIEIIMVQV